MFEKRKTRAEACGDRELSGQGSSRELSHSSRRAGRPSTGRGRVLGRRKTRCQKVPCPHPLPNPLWAGADRFHGSRFCLDTCTRGRLSREAFPASSPSAHVPTSSPRLPAAAPRGNATTGALPKALCRTCKSPRGKGEGGVWVPGPLQGGLLCRQTPPSHTPLSPARVLPVSVPEMEVAPGGRTVPWRLVSLRPPVPKSNSCPHRA